MNCRTYIAALAAVAWIAGAASAGEVSLHLSARTAYVNERVTVQIRITDAQDHQPPEFPDLEAAAVQGPKLGTYSNTSFVNGRLTRQTTVTYTYTVIARRPGKLVIPSIAVRVDGKVHNTAAQTIRVTESQTDDLLLVKLASERESIYFGEAIEVDLEIWLKNYRDRNLPEGLEPRDMLSLINLPRSEWGRFKETLGRIERRELRWQYREAVGPDADGAEQEYDVFMLSLTFVPARLGPVDPGEVNVVVSYPTRTRVERDFFGRRSVKITNSRPIQASLGTSDIMVLAPPEEGRPPEFNGAVGRYRFTAEAHNTEARVREPIELTLTVSGEGELDRVPPPPLASIEALTRDFKVPEERISGVVEKRRKRFVVTIRARRPEVTEIPAIPFVYFDPTEERYVTLRSDPIALRIIASEQVPIAQFDDAGNGAGKVAGQLTETGAGIRANYVDMDEVLARQSFAPGWGSAAWLAGSPLAYVAALLVQRRRLRFRRDPGYARRRKAGARALVAVRAAAGQTDRGRVASDVAAALVGYISDRCNLPSGMTRAEAVEQLAGRGLGDDLVQRVGELLGRCEDLQYAGVDGQSSGDLPEQARRCIRELEGQRL